MTEGTVLIVEDQEELAQAYATVLSTEYTVETVTSGRAALDALEESVDVVLLDRRMPGLSGDEVLERIEESEYSVAVAMLTAVEAGEEVAELPFDEYVAKPIDNEELLALVADLLDRRDADPPLREFLALTSKRSAMERADREPTAAYEAVVERLRSLRAEIDADLDDADEPAAPSQRDW